MDKKWEAIFQSQLDFNSANSSKECIYEGFLTMPYRLRNKVTVATISRALVFITTLNLRRIVHSETNFSLWKFYYNKG